MLVIGFFQDLLTNIGGIVEFVSKPLGELNEQIVIEPFASMSIMSLLGSGLVATLIFLLAFHLIRLIIGG